MEILVIAPHLATWENWLTLPAIFMPTTKSIIVPTIRPISPTH
ncbi:hypothetical protein VPHD526_0016 [Vibrio phage D526]